MGLVFIWGIIYPLDAGNNQHITLVTAFQSHLDNSFSKFPSHPGWFPDQFPRPSWVSSRFLWKSHPWASPHPWVSVALWGGGTVPELPVPCALLLAVPARSPGAIMRWWTDSHKPKERQRAASLLSNLQWSLSLCWNNSATRSSLILPGRVEKCCSTLQQHTWLQQQMKWISPDLSIGTAGWFPRLGQPVEHQLQYFRAPGVWKKTHPRNAAPVLHSALQLCREQGTGCRAGIWDLLSWASSPMQPPWSELISPTFHPLEHWHWQCPKALSSYMVI